MDIPNSAPAQGAMAAWRQARRQQGAFNDINRALRQQDAAELETTLAGRRARVGVGNGRVPLLPLPEPTAPRGEQRQAQQQARDEEPAEGGDADSYAREVTKSMNLDENLLAGVFFGRANLDALQVGMRNRVLNESEGGYAIGRQSEVDLIILMRSVYMDHARHDERAPLLEQVRELNDLVLQRAVRLIMSYIRQDEGYKRDVSTLPELLDRPTFMSSHGQRFFG